MERGKRQGNRGKKYPQRLKKIYIELSEKQKSMVNLVEF